MDGKGSDITGHLSVTNSVGYTCTCTNGSYCTHVHPWNLVRALARDVYFPRMYMYVLVTTVGCINTYTIMYSLCSPLQVMKLDSYCYATNELLSGLRSVTQIFPCTCTFSTIV